MQNPSKGGTEMKKKTYTPKQISNVLKETFDEFKADAKLGIFGDEYEKLLDGAFCMLVRADRKF